MFWQGVTFTPPAAVNGIAAGLTGHLDAAQAAMGQGGQALQGLGLPEPPPFTGEADALRESAGALLSSQARYLAVTPYMQGIGTMRGDHAFLTPQKAIEVIGSRMVEDAVSAAAGGVLPSFDTGLVMLVMAAQEPGQLATALNGFNTVFPIPELRQAERRAKALATIELDKFKIPEAPKFPPWGNAAPERSATGLAVARALGGQLALAEGLEAAKVSPTARLAAFTNKLAAGAQQRQQNLQALAAGMTGASNAWRGIYLEGAVAMLAPLLAKFAPPMDDSFKCCVSVCWYGTKSQVAYFKEAFGLTNPLEGIL